MTAVETQVIHDWRIVAPWWHWPKAADEEDPPPDVRSSAPVIQKYDRPDAVNAFLADPQLRLQFRQTTDRVATVTQTASRFTIPTRTITETRKLFLGSHHRHYLVTCSLHCDTTGFPSVDREAVCEAGFVVRRRMLSVPAEARERARVVLKDYVTARRRRAGAEAQVAAARHAGPGAALRVTQLQARLDTLAGIEAAAAETVRTWADDVGVARGLEGWRPVGVSPDGTTFPTIPACSHDRLPSDPAPLSGVGRWEETVELPEVVEEVSFPLYPLVPDPTLAGHDAHGETIYFGTIPTGSSDVDPSGAARFDDRTTYEIRCFVRRHRPECPREAGHCGCPVTWSEPTEPFQLASHFDLEGTANRPVTVQLPDLRQLHADALRLGPGGTGGVRFQAPPESSLSFSAEDMEATADDPQSSIPQICSFSIPLITIVAMFLFKLILPIVVFVFQLWFLLLLKFCIPPEFEIDAELSAALDALPPSLEFDASIAATFEAGPQFTNLMTALAGATDGYKGRDQDGNLITVTQGIDALMTSGQLDKAGRLALARGMVATTASPTPPPDRIFAPRVERHEVVAP